MRFEVRAPFISSRYCHDEIGVRLGAIDGDPGIRPELRQWVSPAASWEEIPDDGLPRYPEGSP